MSAIDIRRHYLRHDFDEKQAVRYLRLIGFSTLFAHAYLMLGMR